MRVKCENNDILFVSLTIKESFALYSSELYVTTVNPLKNGNYTLVYKDTSADIVLISAKKISSGYYLNKFFSKKYVEYLNKMYGPILTKGKTDAILNSVGIDFNLSGLSTESVFWNIPTLKYRNLVKLIAQRTKVSGGGGVISTVSIDGKLTIVDLKSVFAQTNVEPLICKISSDSSETDWVNSTTGEVNLIQHRLDKVEEKKVTFKAGWGISRVAEQCYLEDEYNLTETELRNEFFKKYYQSRIINVSSVVSENFYLGSLLNLNNVGINAMVYSLDVTVAGDLKFVNGILIAEP